MVKLIKRRVMVTRFRLNQEAYRHRLEMQAQSRGFGGSSKIDALGAPRTISEAGKLDFKRQLQSAVAVKSNLIRWECGKAQLEKLFGSTPALVSAMT